MKSRRGYSCIELIVAVSTVGVAFIAWGLLSPRFGVFVATGGVVASVLFCALVAAKFYMLMGRLKEREMRAIDNRYPYVYRIVSVPPMRLCVTAQGAECKNGDYGWAAEPVYGDGLIYLHGLTKEWTVAWYAGFQPEQIEMIGEKPRSQYFLPYSWICAGAKPPPCPFPVLQVPEESLGFPQRINFPFVQGLNVERMDLRD